MALDAGTGFLSILPTINPAAFNSALAGQLKAQSGALTSILGSSLGGPLGLGVLAAGAAGAAITSMTLSFENAFTRIAALSNASTADIARWKTEVLSLAGETAQAPAELADALFFLSSAGLEASQVMPALTASAKAAATGLGTTSDVANIVASALNAYSDSGLTAAQVTDTLVAAVREGRAEPEEFAQALGRILPIASAIDVSFQDVTASLAALSNIGLDVNEGVTAMRGVLQAIAAPTDMAATGLKKMGLSAQDLLDVIHEDGLVGALRLLDERAQASTKSQADYFGVLRKVVPNIRSLTGALGILEQNAAKVDAIFQAVSDSTGDAAKAFAETTEGPGFAFKKTMNDLKISAVELGEDALPLLTGAVKALDAVIGPLSDGIHFWTQGFKDLFHSLGEGIGNDPTDLFHSLVDVLHEMDPALDTTNMSLDELLAKAHELSDSQLGEIFQDLGRDVAVFVAGAADGIVGAVIPAVDGMVVHIDDAGHSVANFAGLARKDLIDFKESATDSLNFVETAFDDLAGRAHISATQILRSMERALRAEENFGRNATQFLGGVADTLGPGMQRAAQEMVAALAEAGPEGAARMAALNQAIKDGNIGLVRDILDTWNKAEDVSANTVKKVTNVKDSFNDTQTAVVDVRDSVVSLAGAVAGLPSNKHIDITVDVKTFASGIPELADLIGGMIADGFRLDGNP